MRKPAAIHAVTLREGEPGEPVYVCLHGWAGSHLTFQPLAAELDRGRLIAIDLPGYGRSAPPRAWTVDDVLEPIEAFLEDLELSESTLVGNCSGAVLALILASRPSRVDAPLVLVEPFGFVPWYFRVFTLPLLGAALYNLVFRNPLGAALMERATASRVGAHSHASSHRTVPAATALGYLHTLQRLAHARNLDDLRLPRPPLLVHGSDTFEAVRSTVRRWSTHFGGDVADVAGAGHLLLQDQPDAVAKLLRLDEREDSRQPRAAQGVPASGMSHISATIRRAAE